MARSRLSIHAIPHHDPDAIVRFASAIQPPCILIVNPDADFISRCYRASSNSIFSLRNHALSEQKGDAQIDPAGTGDRHAREMVEWCDKIYAEAAARNLPMPPLSQVVLPGINEPMVNTDQEIANHVTYSVHYLDGLTARNRRGSALEFSVGWPRNAGQDTAPQWPAFRLVYEAIKRGNHVASIHEYWPKEGPSMWAGWLCYRCVMWIPDYWADVDFIFTEVGLDDAAMPGRVHAFWKDFFLQHPQAYVDQYHEYEHNNRSLKNRNGVRINVVGYCMFTFDYGGAEWEDADIKNIASLFIHFVNTVNLPDLPAGHDTHLPDISTPGIPQPADPQPDPVVPDPPVSSTPSAGALFDWSINAMCRVFDYDAIVVRAIVRVESGGRPFRGDFPVIRNELHIGHDNTLDQQRWEQHFSFDANERWKNQMWRKSANGPWIPAHVGGNFEKSQALEWEVFEFAKSIDSHAAHIGLGMGAGQIMGFNFEKPNYRSAEEMLREFSDPIWGAANQVMAIFAYFNSTPGLVQAVRNRDLEKIAYLYNGPGQVPYYVKRFKEEIDALTA